MMTKFETCTDRVGLRKVSNIARKYNIRVFHDTPWRKYKPYISESKADLKRRWRAFIVEAKAILPEKSYNEYIAKGRNYSGASLRVRVR